MQKEKKAAFAVAMMATLFLAGCESVEDKAEREYQKSAELAESGEVARAQALLKSVFKLNGEHRDARMLYAQLQLEEGKYNQAYKHFLLVTDQYPNDAAPRFELVEIALRARDWNEVQRHLETLKELAPDDPRLETYEVLYNYGLASQNRDTEAAAKARSRAEELVALDPSNRFAREVVIDALAGEQRYAEAIEQVDQALANDPDAPNLNQAKLSLISQTNDLAALGDHLKVMVERFPENQEVRIALVRWYIAAGDTEGAESFIREMIVQAGDDVSPRVSLVQFLQQIHGNERALEELDQLIEEGLDDRLFRMMRASIVFDDGQRDEGIAEMLALLESSEVSEETREVQTTLARMYIANEEEDKARELVDQVLSEDNRNVPALKLKANWMIDEDKVRDAVLGLRTALDQNPNDSETITLLARAYERDGNRELMADSLGLAVEASSNAPAESMRYARYLAQNQKLVSAETVLIEALRKAPSNIDILQMLGQIYIAMDDRGRAEQVANTLASSDDPKAQAIATGMQTTLLRLTDRTEDSIQLLLERAASDQFGLAAQSAIIRTHLANSDLEAARTYMDAILDEYAGTDLEDGSKYLNAALLTVESNYEEAEAVYEDLLSRNPQAEDAWRAYLSMLTQAGKREKAEAVLDQALVAAPDAPNLLWMKAGLAESTGNIDQAIEIYERLYERDSNSVIVANNLASLITTYRESDEDLQRAYTIARRLRGTDVAPFQDTYGWIAYKLGNYTEALEYLEPAAERLSKDPTILYHLAMNLIALNRTDEALAHLERAVELWGDNTISPITPIAVAELERLKTAAPAADSTQN